MLAAVDRYGREAKQGRREDDLLDHGRQRTVPPDLHLRRAAEGERRGEHGEGRRLRERGHLHQRRVRLPRHPQHTRHERELAEGTVRFYISIQILN